MEPDPKLVILVISNQINGKELFRVHIHELSIRFDDKLQYGIENNNELKTEIEHLNFLWKKQKISQNDIFPIMLDIMTRHADYMKDYFFSSDELNEKGQHIEHTPKENRPNQFFKSLKKQKLIKKITKKEFEHNIKNQQIAEKYVEIFRKKIKYYYYKHYKLKSIVENWYFAEFEGEMIFCFMNK